MITTPTMIRLLVVCCALLLGVGASASDGTELKIIGAALSRTGTSSTAAALERLGYRVWHGHFLVFGDHSNENPEIWHDLFNDVALAEAGKHAMTKDEAVGALVKELSRSGYNATVDQPFAFLFEDLMSYYPNAKVLNTKRNRESWAYNMVTTVWTLDVLSRTQPFPLENWWYGKDDFRLDQISAWMKMQFGMNDHEINLDGLYSNGTLTSVGYDATIRSYDEYQERVRRVVPQAKLVEFDVRGDGAWATLCEHFLKSNSDTKCPTEPFPRKNTAADGFVKAFHAHFNNKIKKFRLGVAAFGLLVTTACAYAWWLKSHPEMTHAAKKKL